MKEQLLPLPFPLKGLVVNQAFDNQPEMTTRSAVNVVGYEPRFGVDRGGQRSGLTKYCPAQINGSSPIQDITHAVSNTFVSGSASSVTSLLGLFAFANTTGATLDS